MSMKGNQRDIFNAYERLHHGSLPMLRRQYKAMRPIARRPMLDVLLELVKHEASERLRRAPKR